MKSLLTLTGVLYRPGGREIVKAIPDDTEVLLALEPSNPHNPNAIAVYLHIGYIKRSEAALLAPKLATSLTEEDTLRTIGGKIARNDFPYVEIEIEEPST